MIAFLLQRFLPRIGGDGRPMVWVHHKRLITVQRDALRAGELEKEVVGLRAGNRALALIDEQTFDADVSPAHPRLVELLEDPPQSASGTLHEPAFLALLEARIWECRLADAAQPSSREV